MAVRPERLDLHPLPRAAGSARARRPRGGEHLRDPAGPPGRPAGGRRRRPAALVDHARRRHLGGRAPPAGQRRAGPGRGARQPVLDLPAACAPRCSAAIRTRTRPSRLWRARTDPPVDDGPTSSGTGSRSATATSHGPFPLADFQTVYAAEPGSAEMASAGRPFTERLLIQAHGPRCPGRADHAAHRRLQPGAARAAVSGAVRRPSRSPPGWSTPRDGPAAEWSPSARPSPARSSPRRTTTASPGPLPDGPTSSSAPTARRAPSPA